MWVLEHRSANRASQILPSTSITIGLHPTCDVVVSAPNAREVEAQLFVEPWIAFFSKKEGTISWLNSNDFDICGEMFRLTNSLDRHFFDHYQCSESTVSATLSEPRFQELLFQVQKLACEMQRTDKMPDLQLLHLILSFLDGRFWVDHRAALPEDRKKYCDIVWNIFAYIKHYGAITCLLSDQDISEIMINGSRSLYIERCGQTHISSIRISERELNRLAEKIASEAGRRVDESSPYCDCRLPDGSRVHIILPPLAVDGICITIRKFPKKKLCGKDLVRLGTCSSEVLEFVSALVRSRKNILVSGGTGTGKTTLLNILSESVASEERIVTIEDSAELQLHQPHVIRLEARVANVEGRGSVSLRELLKNALRMRPDRLLIGECRGSEALDMLQAMNTGHEGSMTTVHANDPQGALRRLETLALFADSGLPSHAIREQIASAIQYIVHLSRDSFGTRRISSVAKVVPADSQMETKLGTETIFEFDTKSGDWRNVSRIQK